MVNPFDLRTVLLAKHAQHVVLIHFLIALFIAGVLFDVTSQGQRTSQLASAAYVNLCAAAWTVLPTAATGILAWHLALDGERIKGIFLWHLLVAWVSVALVIALWWIHWRARKSGSPVLPCISSSLELLGVCLIVLTAHLGGFLSGMNM
jgi:uncharacterized membrane protein